LPKKGYTTTSMSASKSMTFDNTIGFAAELPFVMVIWWSIINDQFRQGYSQHD
jgi:hypothetical protein